MKNLFGVIGVGKGKTQYNILVKFPTMSLGGEIMRVGVSVKRWYREDQNKDGKNYHMIEASTHVGKSKKRTKERKDSG